ncbi:hypothetical protein GBAR_LOCUS16800 [Geodia barretti]|nr:hypothetical protein GBAR_LOCUS16800 [Geodia barretti]
MEVGPIRLSEDSLAQFGKVVDLDAVVRYQLLDNTPQKDRAALSQSKGLKDRRLPSHVATLVGDERPPQRQLPRDIARPKHQPKVVEEPDAGDQHQLTDEEKRQKLMAKVGISQGNPLAALGNILRKGPGRGSGRDSKSPRREVTVTKKPSFKGSKESLRESCKDSTEPSGRPSEQKSPKMFRFGIKRSGSRSKKGEKDDSASDTSSVNSLNVVAVKEEPMEAESSGLTVSRSAGVNERKENMGEVIDKTKSAPEASSKSSNRNSTYFKPPEVEPLTDLFDSGELDALLKPNEGAEKGAAVDSTRENLESAGEEEQASNSGSGLKRNNLRSSFRMYENRYKAETLEKKKEKSPLSMTASVAVRSIESTKKQSSNEEHVAESIPSDTGTPYTKHDGDSIVTSVSPKPEVESCKSEKEKDNERRRRKLFDDELFPSDIPGRLHTKVKSASAATPSLDAYAKAHRSPSPVAVVSDNKDQGKDEIGDNSESNSASPSLKTTDQAESEEEGPRNIPTGEVSESGKEAETMPQDQQQVAVNVPSSSNSCETHVDHEADKDVCVPINTSEEQKTPVPVSPTQTPSEVKSQSVLAKTELEKDSEERKSTMGPSTSDDFHREERKSKTDPSTFSGVSKEAEKQPTLEMESGGTQETEGPGNEHLESTRSEKENPSISTERKRREEKQQSHRSARSNDSRSRIQSGKVSSGRSRFDSSSPSSSPRLQRARASTESPRLASGKKIKRSEDQDSKSPLWMSDMQKKKEGRTKTKEQMTPVKPSADGEDMPDWRRRVLERRRKAAEANTKSPSTDGRVDRISRSGRCREAGGAFTSTKKSPQKDKSPSPSSSKKSSTKAVKSKGKGTSDEGKVKTEDTETKDANKDKQENCKKEVADDPDFGHEIISDMHEKQESTSKPVQTVTSPKPEITSPKPKINIFTKKVAKHSSSSEQVQQSVFSIDVKPSLTPAADDVPEKDAIDDEVFEDTKREIPTDVSSSNLKEKSSVESSETAGSRHSSNSSEKEVGVPFRSRGISHSRSPTPTSLATGPLKLPADPGVPEWKKKMLERKKDSSNLKKPLVPKSESEVPAWKKELLAKRSKIGEESKVTSRMRSSTVPTRPVSATRSGRRKEQPVPEFMKEFQSKKKSTT